MNSSFFGFNIATQGLYTARAGLNIAGHNMANVNTPGYSRQVGEIRATRPLWTGNGKGMLGTGSEVTGIIQIRDKYLDAKYWSSNTKIGEYTIKREQLSMLEALFNEPSDTGFNYMINSFFDSMQMLSTNAGDDAYRVKARESAVSFATYFNTTAQNLTKMQQDLNFSVQAKVEEVNSIALQIQNLNRQIFRSELDGSQANDLRDQRATLIDRLSKIASVEVTEIERNPEMAGGAVVAPEDRHKSEKHFIVKINGQTLVNHFEVNKLVAEPRMYKKNPEDIDGLYDVKWETGIPLNISDSNFTGELKGYLDLRDGNNLGRFQGSVKSVSAPNVNGVTTIVLQNVNRGDMQENGDLRIGDQVFPYGSFQYNEATKEVTLQIPAPQGKIQIGNQTYSYTEVVQYAPATGQMSIKLPTGLTIPPNSKIKLGDREIVYTGDMNYDSATGILSIDSAINLPDAAQIAVNGQAEIGNAVLYKGVPYYMRKLNEFVRTFARAINEGQDRIGQPLSTDALGHRNGYGVNGSTGIAFFTYKDGTQPMDSASFTSYEKMTAANFSLSKEVLEDPRNIAASDRSDFSESDNQMILQFLALKNNTSLFREGKPGSYMEAIISELGVDGKQAKVFEENQTNLSMVIQNQRLSVSGVNLDEEIASLMKFQHAYNAAAKMISVFDEIYNTTINNMGAR